MCPLYVAGLIGQATMTAVAYVSLSFALGEAYQFD